MAGYAAAVLADAPGAWMRHSEPTGTAVVDAVGGASGAYVGGFTLAQAALPLGETDAAVRFNGSTGYARFAKRAAFNLGNGPFSLECWARLDALPRSGTTAVVMDFGARSVISRIEPDGLWICRQNSVVDIAIATVRLAAGVLYHLVITRDAAGVTRMFVNAVEVTPRSVTSTTLSNNSIEFNIASADAGTSGNMLGGTVDETAVYPSVLTPARVLAHYQAGRSIGIGQALEASGARPLTPTKRVALGQAAESSTAAALRPIKVAMLRQAIAVDAARPLTPTKRVALGQAAEISTAWPLVPRKLVGLGQAVELDSARPLGVQLEAPPPAIVTPTFLAIDARSSSVAVDERATSCALDPVTTSVLVDSRATEVLLDA